MVLQLTEPQCKKPEGASPATTPVQLSLPYSAATSAPGDASSTITLVQHSMPPNAAARASELPRHALDQARQENQSPDDTRTSETQIEASSRSPEILPCVLEYIYSCIAIESINEIIIFSFHRNQFPILNSAWKVFSSSKALAINKTIKY